MNGGDGNDGDGKARDVVQVSLLGSGRVGGGLARALAGRGCAVVVGDRDPTRRAAMWEGPPVRHVSMAEAAAASEVVIHATPGSSALELLLGLRDPLRGKILVDVANATTRQPDGSPGGLYYSQGSLAERIQTALPETRVVKALNTMIFSVMTAPGALSAPPTVFVSGNDAAAKGQATRLLLELGWRREWILDLGGIDTARATEAVMLLVPHVLRAQGFAPFAIGVVR